MRLERLILHLAIASLTGLMAHDAVAAVDLRGEAPLPLETQREFALHFAPTFIFSPEESYFPTDPYAFGGFVGERFLSGADLDVVQNRAAIYEDQTLAAKLQQATIYYRVYLSAGRGPRRAVVEYWLYYVMNSYTARGTVIPLRSGVSHVNDLEHVFLIARERASGRGKDPEGHSGLRPDDFAIESIIASAHNINNAYRFPDWRRAPQRVRFLVERGSHALAPDIDEDLLFHPQADADRSRKMIWGIRDEGQTLARYRAQYYEARPAKQVVVLGFTPEERESLRNEGFQQVYPYALSHEEYLEDQYREMTRSSKEMTRAMEGKTGIIRRLFGEPERGSQLLVPSQHLDFGAPGEMLNRRVNQQRGFNLGITTMMEGRVNLSLGGRYAWALNRRFLPDLMVDSQAFVTANGDAFWAGELLGFYPVDAITNAFMGVGFITDSFDFRRRQIDWISGVEFHLGHFRVRSSFRTKGELYNLSHDFRVSYVF